MKITKTKGRKEAKEEAEREKRSIGERTKVRIPLTESEEEENEVRNEDIEGRREVQEGTQERQ